MEELGSLLGGIGYLVPVLVKQKMIKARQTVHLVDAGIRYVGHLEIGSTGRYFDALQTRLSITGDVFRMHTGEARHGPENTVDREQLSNLGTQSNMVTAVIRFHHCPLQIREQYISEVRDLIWRGVILDCGSTLATSMAPGACLRLLTARSKPGACRREIFGGLRIDARDW